MPELSFPSLAQVHLASLLILQFFLCPSSHVSSIKKFFQVPHTFFFVFEFFPILSELGFIVSKFFKGFHASNFFRTLEPRFIVPELFSQVAQALILTTRYFPSPSDLLSSIHIALQVPQASFMSCCIF
jgi:hypothetical protein